MSACWLAVFAGMVFWRLSGAPGADAITEVGAWPLPLALLIVFAAFALREGRLEPRRPKRSLLLACPALFAALAAPFPWCVPPGLLTVGLLLLALARRSAPREAARGLLGAGLLLSLQGLAVAALPSLMVRRHDLQALAPLFASALRFVGLDAASAGGGVSLAGPGAVVLYTVRLESLLPSSFVLLAVGGSVALLLSGRRRAREHLALYGCLGGYACLRLLVVIALQFEIGGRALFLDPAIQLVSLLPALGLALWIERGRELTFSWSLGLEPAESSRRLVRAALTLALAPVACALALNTPGLGPSKGGRLLVDEGHSEWESTVAALDTATYGMGTVYTYRSMTEFLAERLSEVRRTQAPLTAEVLAGCDVLVLKTPTRPYAEAEVRAVVDFVEDGGGLWLIGDHTNVFGSGTYLNQVADRFGIRFRPDATASLLEGHNQRYVRPRWFAHPVVANTPGLLYMTSDSLALRGPAEVVMLGENLYVDDPDYSVFNFFGDFRVEPYKPHGLFAQCAARVYGEGKVLAFSDSTIFSNFAFFLPGISELALTSVAWLDREELGLGWRFAAALAALGAVLASLRALRAADGAARVLTVTLGLWVGIGAASLLHAGLTRWIAPGVTLADYAPTVAFVQDGAGYRLPLRHETHDWDADNLHTFFVSLQRIGLRPRVVGSVAEATGATAIVLADRIEPTSDADLCRLDRYVRGGGRLLVMDHAGGGALPVPGSEAAYHPQPAAETRALLAHFGVSVGQPQATGAVFAAEGAEDFSGIVLERPLAMWGGGAAALVDAQGLGIAAVRTWGEGRVVGFGASRAFSVARMGATLGTPNADQLRRHQLEYWIFRNLLGLGDTPASRGDER